MIVLAKSKHIYWEEIGKIQMVKKKFIRTISTLKNICQSNDILVRVKLENTDGKIRVEDQ